MQGVVFALAKGQSILHVLHFFTPRCLIAWTFAVLLSPVWSYLYVYLKCLVYSLDYEEH